MWVCEYEMNKGGRNTRYMISFSVPARHRQQLDKNLKILSTSNRHPSLHTYQCICRQVLLRDFEQAKKCNFHN